MDANKREWQRSSISVHSRLRACSRIRKACHVACVFSAVVLSDFYPYLFSGTSLWNYEEVRLWAHWEGRLSSRPASRSDAQEMALRAFGSVGDWKVAAPSGTFIAPSQTGLTKMWVMLRVLYRFRG